MDKKETMSDLLESLIDGQSERIDKLNIIYHSDIVISVVKPDLEKKAWIRHLKAGGGQVRLDEWRRNVNIKRTHKDRLGEFSQGI